jgi:lipopolysaccharide export LptBFGC system permease protein LptF
MSQNAAFVTSTASVLVIFLGPVVGFVLDRIGGQIYICFACSFLVIFAYYLLAFTMLEPLIRYGKPEQARLHLSAP